MVGITGRLSRREPRQGSFAESLRPLLHTERLNPHIAYRTDVHSVGYTAYPEYPIRTFEADGVRVCFEGRLYDRPADAVESEVIEVARRALADDPDPGPIRDWLLDVDGEFLLVACDVESGRLAVLNDALARLPTYYYRDEDAFVLSREIRYLLESIDVEFDRLGVAQCLLFGYTLGDRTIVEGVSRLRPATLLTVEPDSLAVTTTRLHTFDFDEHRHDDRSRTRNASELVSRFETACENRAGYADRDVISLSGGLDSRSVLAGYAAAGLSPVAATMESEEYVARSDVEIAERLAADFDVDWRTYHVGHPTGADLDTLVKTKNGHIGLMTSFILDFFRQLEAEFGPDVTYITGDGGDKALPDLTPVRSLSEDDLVDYVLAQNSLVDVERVAELTRLSEGEIRRSVREHVDAFPERTPAGKYVHFLVYGRAVNFLFEGEDRNRLFFWSVTPFYSLPFFRYAMNCPPEQKERYKLYRSFLGQLAPSAAGRVHPIYGAPVDSSRHALAALVDDVLSRYPSVFETVKPFIKAFNDLDTGSTVGPDTVDCIRHQVDRNDVVDDLFDRQALDRIIDAHDEYGKFTLYRIFALTSVVDDIHSTRSVLEANRDAVFA
ncbi:hypothetical protein [Salinilacihabitans rarus]|uniref:hypothetical protein n=1 Tax=Salinilacihabitans rarus TaxID=2961596 RepID=UPI0020C8E287|nr:hypothetical protein [Salinilacihabitans rarus]